MAVTVKTGGTFTKAAGDRPGLYVRFVEKAIAAISAGARSKVATIKSDFSGGTAEADKVYRVTNMEQANTLFGKANTEDIRLMFVGGASEVVISTVDASDEASVDWDKALNKLETYEFHVYVNPIGAITAVNDAAYTWLKTCKENGMNFIAVFTDKANEGNVTAIKTSATAKADEYTVFVGGGVTNPDGSEVSADKYACYIAGVIAGTALDGSLTYLNVPFAETITRFRTPDIKDLLAAGVLVTVMDGDRPRIEQGLTLGNVADKEFNKIRTVRAKQAMIDDINRAVNGSYIGKITNNENGQVAVINAIKLYLQTLSDANVIANDFIVELDKTQVSQGADVYINVTVRFLDSIEYVYLTISI